MRYWALTMLWLLATLLITNGSPEQCASQAGGALCQSQYSTTPPPPPPPATPSPPSVGDITNLITSSMFDVMLPYRNIGSDIEDFYTYDAFITAAKSFPTFATTGDTDTCKRELAAFFGQTSHQTTCGAPSQPFVYGYCHVEQVSPIGDYCNQESETQWPCAPGKQYYGRRPIQLSYNYNYGQAGEALGLDLLNNPDLVATDPVISFKTALWFWMTTQLPKPSCHDVIIANWTPTQDDQDAGRVPGYGVITNILNGGLESGRGHDTRVEDRIGFYQRYCSDELFEVSTGDNLDCYNQAPFPPFVPFGTGLLLDSM
uniref:chitinase n=1 Tax=Camellia fraterna TaxID=542725 RepID=A0A2I6RLF3_9ERIC|nr:chitinase [Camellia fraterna]